MLKIAFAKLTFVNPRVTFSEYLVKQQLKTQDQTLLQRQELAAYLLVGLVIMTDRIMEAKENLPLAITTTAQPK